MHIKGEVPGSEELVCWCWGGPCIGWLAIFGFAIRKLEEKVCDSEATVVLAQHVRTTNRFYDNDNHLKRTDTYEIAEVFPLDRGGGGRDSYFYPDYHFDTCSAPPEYRVKSSVTAIVRVARISNRVMSRQEIRGGGQYVFPRVTDPTSGQVVPRPRKWNDALYDRCLNMGGKSLNAHVQLEFLMQYGQLIYSYEADAAHFPPSGVEWEERSTWTPGHKPPKVPSPGAISKLLDDENPSHAVYPDGLDRTFSADGRSTPDNLMDDADTWGGKVSRSDASAVVYSLPFRSAVGSGGPLTTAFGHLEQIVEPSGVSWDQPPGYPGEMNRLDAGTLRDLENQTEWEDGDSP